MNKSLLFERKSKSPIVKILLDDDSTVAKFFELEDSNLSLNKSEFKRAWRPGRSEIQTWRPGRSKFQTRRPGRSEIQTRRPGRSEIQTRRPGRSKILTKVLRQ